jgi:hypothetical protein
MHKETKTMQRKLLPISIFIIILTLLACNSILPFGNSAVTVDNLPVYPGATELQQGESNIADTLAANEDQNAAINQALGSLGGGKLEQKGFQLPTETTWEQVKGFYEKELTDGGWSSGLGGLAGNFVDVNAVMDASNQGNDLFQTAIWSKGKQTLNVIMVTDPTDQTQKQLLFSLSTR